MNNEIKKSEGKERHDASSVSTNRWLAGERDMVGLISHNTNTEHIFTYGYMPSIGATHVRFEAHTDGDKIYFSFYETDDKLRVVRAEKDDYPYPVELLVSKVRHVPSHASGQHE